jgi:hypothetical protein
VTTGIRLSEGEYNTQISGSDALEERREAVQIESRGNGIDA